MKRGAGPGRSGESTFQDKGTMRMQACRCVEYLRKSKEANIARVRKSVVYREVKELARAGSCKVLKARVF